MKYFYIAVQHKLESGYHAYWIRVSTSDNLVAKMRPFTAANICKTKSDAIRIASVWNDCFIKNGTYAFKEENITDDEMLLPF